MIVSFLSSCKFVSNTLIYKDTSKEFIETIMNQDYDKSLNYMAIEHETAKNINIDTMKLVLSNFRELVVNNFGTQLKYSFMKSEKTFSTIEGESTSPNTTEVLIELSNSDELGAFKLLFDDHSKKILSMYLLDVKQPKPKMTIFWLFGLLSLSVPILNIYVIRKIKKSDLKKKWLKYLAVIFLNVPAFSYAAVNGFSFSLLSFQILLGVSFSYMGYLGSIWTFGLPLGGIYWLFKLNKIKNSEMESTETVSVAEILTDKNEIIE